jgi:hypothetical protein
MPTRAPASSRSRIRWATWSVVVARLPPACRLRCAGGALGYSDATIARGAEAQDGDAARRLPCLPSSLYRRERAVGEVPSRCRLETPPQDATECHRQARLLARSLTCRRLSSLNRRWQRGVQNSCGRPPERRGSKAREQPKRVHPVSPTGHVAPRGRRGPQAPESKTAGASSRYLREGRVRLVGRSRGRCGRCSLRAQDRGFPRSKVGRNPPGSPWP